MKHPSLWYVALKSKGYLVNTDKFYQLVKGKENYRRCTNINRQSLK